MDGLPGVAPEDEEPGASTEDASGIEGVVHTDEPEPIQPELGYEAADESEASEYTVEQTEPAGEAAEDTQLSVTAETATAAEAAVLIELEAVEQEDGESGTPDAAAPPHAIEAEDDVTAEDAPVPDAAGESDQLSLEAMVDALKEPEADHAVTETESEESAEPSEPEAAGEPPKLELVTTEVEPSLARDSLSAKLPFWIYAAAWLVFSGVMTGLLWAESTGSLVNRPLYAVFVVGGAVLAIAGPLLGLIVWVSLRGVSSDERQGLVRAAFMRAAGWTLAGVVVWWLAFALLDAHRAGMLG